MSSPNTSYATKGWLWAADNGCFSDRWDEERWAAWLNRTSGSLFAVVPDVVGDAEATRSRWTEHVGKVIDAKHTPAYVLQDGQSVDGVPWDEAGAVFVGGSTEFKMSLDAERLVREARRRGLWAHMGRVNSLRRLRIAASWGCQSADGTFLAFGPKRNVPRLIGWLRGLNNEPEQLTLGVAL